MPSHHDNVVNHRVRGHAGENSGCLLGRMERRLAITNLPLGLRVVGVVLADMVSVVVHLAAVVVPLAALILILVDLYQVLHKVLDLQALVVRTLLLLASSSLERLLCLHFFRAMVS